MSFRRHVPAGWTNTLNMTMSVISDAAGGVHGCVPAVQSAEFADIVTGVRIDIGMVVIDIPNGSSVRVVK